MTLISEVVLAITGLALAALMPLMLLLLARVLVDKQRVSTRELMLWISAFTNIVFVFCVSIPYYFQGYKHIYDPYSLTEQLGWVKLWPINAFNYVYINMHAGFGLLYISRPLKNRPTTSGFSDSAVTSLLCCH